MIGQTISHYRILEKLGEGGMGVVYKAEDTKLHRPVALKFLPLHGIDSPAQSRLLIHEAQAAASLNHPNIATIFEFSEVEDPKTHTTQAFIAMEYVEGSTLKEVIRQGPLPIDRIRSFVSQIAHGLSTAHSRGIVHRDIKPSNLIVTKDELIKLLDFGIAKSITETASVKSTVAGSAAYMSPEVIQGGKTDKRSDLWALGVLIFEMLTGKLPFRGEHSPAVMYSIVNEDPLPLKEQRPDAPDDLALICQRCLEKDPDRRLQSVDDIFPLLGLTPSPLHIGLVLSRTTFAAILGGLALIATIWFVIQRFFPSAPQQELRIAVLPFQNLTQKPELSSWSFLLQAMLVGELTGMEGVGVVEPLSLNTVLKSSFGRIIPARSQEVVKVAQSMEITYLIDGTVTRNDTGTILQTFVRNIVTGEQAFSRSGSVSSEEDLSPAVRTLAREIASYLQVKGVASSREKDLLPWTARQPTRALAVSEFLQANQYIFEDISGAEKHLWRAIELDSFYIAPRIWLISGLMQRGRTDEAQAQRQTLERLESSASPFEQSMITWAGAYIEGDLTRQSHALKMALSFSPRNNILLMNLARIRYLLDDFDGAIEALTPAIQTQWQYSPAHYLLALCYDLKNDPARAEEVLEQSLSIRPVYGEIYLLLAKYTFGKRDSTKALEYEELYSRRAREVGQKPEQVFLALAENRAAFRSYDKAVEYFDDALRADRRNPAIRQARADALFESNRMDEAVREFHALLKKDSTLVHCYNQIGSYYLLQGDTVRAMGQFRHFLRWDSTSQESEAVKQRILQLSR